MKKIRLLKFSTLFFLVTISFVVILNAEASDDKKNLVRQNSRSALKGFSNPVPRYMDIVEANLKNLIENERVLPENIRFNEAEDAHLLGKNQRSPFIDPKFTYKLTPLFELWDSSSFDDFVESGRKAKWYFNAELEIWDTTPKENGEPSMRKKIGDITAFLPGMKAEHCKAGPKTKLRSEQQQLYKSNMVATSNGDYLIKENPPKLDVEEVRREGCLESFDGTELIYYKVLYDNQNVK